MKVEPLDWFIATYLGTLLTEAASWRQSGDLSERLQQQGIFVVFRTEGFEMAPLMLSLAESGMVFHPLLHPLHLRPLLQHLIDEESHW